MKLREFVKRILTGLAITAICAMFFAWFISWVALIEDICDLLRGKK